MRRTRFGAVAIGLTAVGVAAGQDLNPVNPAASRSLPEFIIPGESEISTLYFDGSETIIDTYERWRFMCGTDLSLVDTDQLVLLAERHLAEFADIPAVIVDNNPRGSTINIVFNTSASVPTAALDGFAIAEAYLESLFGDNITVNVNCSFADMGGGVIGATGSSYVGNVSYNNSRNGLQNGMDGDDSLQLFLPAGSSIPVRYNGSSATITNEDRIDWTRANYRATIGTSSGTAANMTYNSSFNFDYNPANGVGSRTSFVDVVIHETGHAMGFTSAADSQSGGAMEALDLIRFQRSDGANDYNPDTTDEFQTKPRLVDYNTPNDDHISDIITNEYRMSDGTPYQASHFREQSGHIGLMDPALAGGETHYPDYFAASDKNVFDFIGYDYPPVQCEFSILSQPNPSQTFCAGQTAQLSVVTDAVAPTYQWRIGVTDLENGGNISGANNATLTISNLSGSDVASDYNCVVGNGSGCNVQSEDASIAVSGSFPVFTDQPDTQSVNVGEPIVLTIAVNNFFNYTYQWRRNGANLSDDERIAGSTSLSLFIEPAQAGDAGEYDCVVTSLVAPSCFSASNAATVTVNSEPPDCPGDLDGNLVVDLSDLSIMLGNFGVSSGAGPEDGDLDGDQDVDLTDLSLLLGAYGAGC